MRNHARKGLKVGVAVAGGGHLNADGSIDGLSDQQRAVIAREFSSLSPENQTKWEFLHPEQGRYNFAGGDTIFEFAAQHGQVVRGHTLFWHSQNPEWLEQGQFSEGELREILRDHILTVAGRYRGRVQQWDVANEVFHEDGTLRLEGNIWLRELGPEILADAFRWAAEADPHAYLFFNDYNVEGLNAKSDAYFELAHKLREQGVRVDGFSAQAHLSLAYPFPDTMAANFARFDKAGFHTAVTELDVRGPVPAYTVAANMSEENRVIQAEWYGRVADICSATPGCLSLTVWGLLDEQSWVPGVFPGEGDALMFEGDFAKKPAYYALRSALHAGR